MDVSSDRFLVTPRQHSVVWVKTSHDSQARPRRGDGKDLQVSPIMPEAWHYLPHVPGVEFSFADTALCVLVNWNGIMN